MKNHMLGFIVCDVEKGGDGGRKIAGGSGGRKWREKYGGRKMAGTSRKGGENGRDKLAGESGGRKRAQEIRSEERRVGKEC